jgi:hypothetical protein
MSDETNSVLFTALSTENDVGNSFARAVRKRITECLDKMNFTHAGFDKDRNVLRRHYTECSSEQQLRASRMAEYELRDQLAMARNNHGKASVEPRTKRIDRLEGELETLLHVLPTRLSDSDLEAIITALALDVIEEKSGERPSKIIAFALNKLRKTHFGCYDGRTARDMTSFLINSHVGFDHDERHFL